MPWPSTDSEMKGGDNGYNSDEYGDCEVLLLVRVKKERLEEPNSSNGKMRWKKSNRPDDEPEEKNQSLFLL